VDSGHVKTEADIDRRHLERALTLAARGAGFVEPNPLVGCVIARGADAVGEGWHTRFGAPHAEVEALRAAGDQAAGATLYVTLEPCCHHGKTPPCTDAIIRAGLARVVVAQHDPFPQVAGRGIEQLRQAGVRVDVGLLAEQAEQLNAPYLKLLRAGRPWVIAKWAMTLDGKIATRTGNSRWISNAAARARVHQLRGRVDAIAVGRGTAVADDPQLLAEPAGPRLATRIVLDTRAALSVDSRLVRTARAAPVLVAVGPEPPAEKHAALTAAGCEVFVCAAAERAARLAQLLDELGRRRMTNVLVEGGGQLLGSLFDARAVDEVHVFLAAKVLGGQEAPGPVAGIGIDRVADAVALVSPVVEQVDGDLYVHGRLTHG
jgi:diaminohydroxyphosphoribosylaminopyrimidine deaminase / 5-amino-6-(5-phosphoribosylamino)uracil reductase